MNMYQLLSLLLYFLCIPLLIGGVYTICSKTSVYYLDRVWASGFVIYLSFFSIWFRVCIISGLAWTPARIITISKTCMIVFSLLGIILLKLENIIKFPKWGGFKYRYAFVLVFVFFLFGMGVIFLNQDYSGIQKAYITCYCADAQITNPNADFENLAEYQMSTLGVYHILFFYLAVNGVTSIEPELFLKFVMPLLHLLLSVGCYGFLADVFKIKERKQYLFLILVYALYIITVFQERYYLYGIYTNFWEPLTVYASIYLPFIFGMMIFMEEAVNTLNLRNIITGVFWMMVVYWIGSLYTIKNIFVILAPIILGIVLGIVRRCMGSQSRT